MFRIILLFLAATASPAQTFEVAAIHPAAPLPGENATRPRITTNPDRLTARDATLLDCIEWAWNVREYQVSGPDWIRTEKFDIAAKAPRPSATAELRAMLQALLADRFALRLRRETRELPVLAIVAAKHGPKLHAAPPDEAPGIQRTGPGLRLAFTAQTVADLAAFLSTLAVVDRPVLDATHLPGRYTFTLDLNEVVRANDPAAPSIGTVLTEQLGLRLEGRRMPLETLLLDHVEKPR